MDEDLPTRPLNTSMARNENAPAPIWLVSFSEHDDRELNAKQIASALNRGEISPATIVWREGMTDWRAIWDVEALAPLVEHHISQGNKRKRTVVGGFGRDMPPPAKADLSTAPAHERNTPATAPPLVRRARAVGATRSEEPVADLAAATLDGDEDMAVAAPEDAEATHPTASELPSDPEMDFGHSAETKKIPLVANRRVTLHGTGFSPDHTATAPPEAPPRLARPSRAPPAQLPRRSAGLPKGFAAEQFVPTRHTARLPDVASRSLTSDRATLEGVPSPAGRRRPVSLEPGALESLQPESHLNETPPGASSMETGGIFDVSLQPGVEELDLPITVEVEQPSQERIRESMLAGPALGVERPSIGVDDLTAPTVPQFAVQARDRTGPAPVVPDAPAPPLASRATGVSNTRAMAARRGAQAQEKKRSAWPMVILLASITGAAVAVYLFVWKPSALNRPSAVAGRAQSEAVGAVPQGSAGTVQMLGQTDESAQPEAATIVNSPPPAVAAQVAPRTTSVGSLQKARPTRVRARTKALATPKAPSEAKPTAKQETKPKAEPLVPREPAETTQAAASEPFNTGAARSALTTAARNASSCRGPDDPSGVARVSVTFSPSGRAVRAVVQGPPFAGTKTGGCIAARLRAARVPPFQGDRVTVKKKVVVQ